VAITISDSVVFSQDESGHGHRAHVVLITPLSITDPTQECLPSTNRVRRNAFSSMSLQLALCPPANPLCPRVCSLDHLSTHTRFQLSLRTRFSPKRYHKLLLFRLSPVTKGKPSHDAEDASLSVQVTDDGESILKDVELYCMEATCPHLSAPLSHAEFAEPEVDEDHQDRSGACDGTGNGHRQEDQKWDLEPEMRDMEDVIGQPGRTIVCPWHLYDFDLRDGTSSTGMSVCVYSVEVRQRRDGSEWDVFVEEPEADGAAEEDERSPKENMWEIVEIRGVSEDFADPPPPPKAVAPKPEASESNPGMLSTVTSALGRALNIGDESPASTSTPQHDSELPTKTLLSSALLILQTSSASEKIRRTRQTLSALRTGNFKSLKPSQKDVNAARELFAPLEPAEEAERISRGEDVKQGRTVEGFVPPRDDNIKTVDVWNVKSRGKGGNEKSRILMLRTHCDRCAHCEADLVHNLSDALANIEQWAIDLSYATITLDASRCMG
jgi:nitrite reductase/ring-hydroxylating ferredoxin subunit